MVDNVKFGKKASIQKYLENFSLSRPIEQDEVTLEDFISIFWNTSRLLNDRNLDFKLEIDLLIASHLNLGYSVCNRVVYNYINDQIVLTLDRNKTVKFSFDKGEITYISDDKLSFLSSILLEMRNFFYKYRRFGIAKMDDVVSSNSRFIISFDGVEGSARLEKLNGSVPYNISFDESQCDNLEMARNIFIKIVDLPLYYQEVVLTREPPKNKPMSRVRKLFNEIFRKD